MLKLSLKHNSNVSAYKHNILYAYAILWNDVFCICRKCIVGLLKLVNTIEADFLTCSNKSTQYITFR